MRDAGGYIRVVTKFTRRRTERGGSGGDSGPCLCLMLEQQQFVWAKMASLFGTSNQHSHDNAHPRQTFLIEERQQAVSRHRP